MQTFELMDLTKYAGTKVEKLYIDTDGNMSKTPISTFSVLRRMNNTSNLNEGHYYGLLRHGDVIVQKVPEASEYVFENVTADDNKFVATKTFSKFEKDKESMANLESFSRRIDLEKRLSGSKEDVDLSLPMFATDKIKIKVKQCDKEYYCSFIPQHIVVTSQIYIFIKTAKGVELKEVPYNKYLYKSSLQTNTGRAIDAVGWLAVPEGTAFASVEDVITDDCKITVNIYDGNGNAIPHDCKSLDDLKATIDNYECYAVEEDLLDKCVDFDDVNNTVRVMVDIVK